MIKLVRDRMLEVNGIPMKRVEDLTDEQIEGYYKAKILEEAKELVEAPQGKVSEEAADLIDIVLAYCKRYHNLDWFDICYESSMKEERRGAFEDAVVAEIAEQCSQCGEYNYSRFNNTYLGREFCSKCFKEIEKNWGDE